jgi:thiamine pyrophosphokinase
VTLVGGGPVAPAELAAALALAPEVVAADGGGDHPLPPGHAFRAVIGDMDSLAGADRLRAAGVPIHAVGEQDTTDLEKCLYSIEAPLFIGLGFLGGRIDHHLAAMNALAKQPEKPVVLIGGGELCFLCPRTFEIDLAAGTRVSLFPMAPVTGASEGLRWRLDGLAFRPDGRTGTSNAALGGRMRLAFDAPRMLLILPAALLGPVAERLRGARAAPGA